MRRRFIKLTLTTVLVSMLAVTATSNALASPYNHDDLVIVSPEKLTQLREQHRGAASNAAMATGASQGDDAQAYSSGGFVNNPYGCYGLTEYPHKSTDSGFDEVSLHARSECPGNFVVPFLWVQTQLYRETHCAWSTCFGSEPWGPVDTQSIDYGYSVQANSRGACLNSWYKGVSAHMMRGWDGNTYYSFTINRAEVSDC